MAGIIRRLRESQGLSAVSKFDYALHDRHHIFDHNMPTLEDLLDHPAERENADVQDFPDGEKDIVALVQHELAVK